MKNILILINLLLFLFSASLFAAEVKHINNEEIKKLIEEGAPVIDVRATSEWKKTGVIEESHLLMFYDEKGNYELDKWLENVAQISKKDMPVVLICHSGVRSKQLAKYLNKVAGYTQVYNAKGGIVDWIKKENQVVGPSQEDLNKYNMKVTQ